ncbi:MerR family transcriptional regulator [Neorhizobium petrolearium]|uniref:MerR family transcriptional regulator n=1 Tax=Neorhizobium petrolearium TaxID=515361 RepID=A0ABY8M7G8_9HYPH|nr:MerR family transcriptional regulator [Neorhizobium petrolearium]MCC2610331.1 MerR family transcriptional regulator [Neorhizobium petrolearium]WGI70483.1 MerR family transcriptional regulator [Neorhizobium petrolearium]
MRSDAIHTIHGGGAPPALGTAPGHFNFLPQVSLPFDMPEGPVAIAEMADLFGVTHRTLHFYEEKGLITAKRFGAMRIYDSGDIQRMAVINACREIGMPVAVIQDLMEELTTTTSQAEADELFHTMLARRKRELTADISNIRRQMQQIESLLSGEDEDEVNETCRPVSLALTDMEGRCLALMAEGYSAPRIARVLNLQFEELRHMEDGIIRKFEATNRFQAVAKALLLGVVPN